MIGGWYRLALAAVVAGAMAASAWWVWRVPILAPADEDLHFDYVVSLLTNGGPLLASERQVAENGPGFFHPFAPLTHPYTLHLEAWSRARVLRGRPATKAPPGYGIKDFYARIDRSTPLLVGAPFRSPFLVSEYPIGYYGLAALWCAAWNAVIPGLTALFFAARCLSVLLLGVGLIASFAVLRRLGSSPAWALAIVGVVGFLPVTSYVSSYVQPDNLSFAMVAVCLWLGLRAAGERPANAWSLLLVGLSLALLQLTKLQFFLATAIPLVARLALSERRWAGGRWLAWTLLLAAPSLVAAEVQLWISAGGSGPQLRNATSLGASRALLEQAGSWPVYAVRMLRKMAADFFGGTTFRTFWTRFGWDDTALVIGSPAVQEVVTFLIQLGVLVTLALLLMRAQQVAAALIGLWRRGAGRRALRLLVADPLVNAHLLFAAIVVTLYVVTNNAFLAQGRNWYPFLPAMIWESVRHAPRALASRRVARVVSIIVLGALLLYAAAGTYWVRRAVETRYYSGRPPGS